MTKRVLHIFVVCLVVLMAVATGGCGSSKKTATKTSPSSSANVTPSKPVKKLSPEMSVDDRLGHKIVQEARKWLGTPYVYGGLTRGKGTDCSGMTMTVIEKVAEVKIPRNSARQQEYCMTIDRRLLEPGDLVFFASKRGGSKVSHVGIYIGENKVIHASSSRGVIISSLSETYYDSHFHSAGRIKGLTCAATGRKVKKQKSGKSELPIPAQTTIPSTSPVPAPPVSVKEISLDELLSSAPGSRPDTVAETPPLYPGEPAVIDLPTINPDTAHIEVSDIPSPERQAPALCRDTTAVNPDSIRSEVKRAMQGLF